MALGICRWTLIYVEPWKRPGVANRLFFSELPVMRWPLYWSLLWLERWLENTTRLDCCLARIVPQCSLTFHSCLTWVDKCWWTNHRIIRVTWEFCTIKYLKDLLAAAQRYNNRQLPPWRGWSSSSTNCSYLSSSRKRQIATMKSLAWNSKTPNLIQ